MQVTHHNVLAKPLENEQKRGGFTLIETLTTVSVIALLAALLMPAVQQVRDAARRTQEMNDMKQVGSAFHNFASTYDGKLPAAVKHDENTGQLVPWTVELLPYLDQANLYNQYDRTKLPNEQSPEVLQARVEVLQRYDEGADFSPSSIPGNRQPRGISMLAVGGDGVYRNEAAGWDDLPPSDPGFINAQGRFFPEGNRTGFNGLVPPHEQVKLDPVSKTAGLTNLALAIQHNGPNGVADRPYFNPHNYTIPGPNGSPTDQNGKTIHKSTIEVNPTTVYEAPPSGSQSAIPHDIASEAYFLQNWTVTALGVGKYPNNTVTQAYRGYSHLRDTTFILRGDGSVTKFLTKAAGTAGDVSGLEILRGMGDRNKGTNLE